jgi:hypothetical protein
MRPSSCGGDAQLDDDRCDLVRDLEAKGLASGSHVERPSRGTLELRDRLEGKIPSGRSAVHDVQRGTRVN